MKLLAFAFLVISIYLLNNVSGDCQFKRVCYYENWSFYRDGEGKMVPEDIDPSLCTHIMYGFALLDDAALTIKIQDQFADIDVNAHWDNDCQCMVSANGHYKKVTDFKKQGLKVMIALGGWNDSIFEKYSRLVGDAAARKKFIDNVIIFMETHNFDGLDLDWEYPRCWQNDCNLGPASDKDNFVLWAKELSEAFKPKGFLLSAAVSAAKPTIDKAYDVAALGKYLDFINVMTYDFHGAWDGKTGHVSPFISGDAADFMTTAFAMDYFVEKGAPKEKLIMGMPMYGQSFTLSSSDTSLNAPTSGKGKGGLFTQQAGLLAYMEICKFIKDEGWTVNPDEGICLQGPYAFKGDQWVGYDDVAMITQKSKYIKGNGFGGGMIWALGLDDFKGNCGGGKYPLLSAITKVLASDDSGCPVITTTTEGTDNGGTDNGGTDNGGTDNGTTTPVPPVGGGCVPTDTFKAQPGMAEWCITNCALGNCPASHCICT